MYMRQLSDLESTVSQLRSELREAKRMYEDMPPWDAWYPCKADPIHRLCLFIDVYGVCDDKKGDLEAIRLLPRKLMSQSRGMFDA